MAIDGFSLSQFLQPTDFFGFIATVLVICVAAGIGNGSIFKMIPLVNPREVSAIIGIVSYWAHLEDLFRLCCSATAFPHSARPPGLIPGWRFLRCSVPD